MKLIKKWFGVFVVDNGNVIDWRLFPKDSKEIAKKLELIEDKQTLDEELDLRCKYKVMNENDSIINIEPQKYGFSYEYLKEAVIILSKKKITKLMPEINLITCVNTYEHLVKLRNYVIECRIEHEVYGDEVTSLQLKELQFAIENSIKSIDEKIEKDISVMAPKLSEVCTPILAVKLIAKAGSLEKLALLPASTIQLLGAEKAFFKYLHTKTKCPKYGIIYQHPNIQNANNKEIGKESRKLACKIALAAKIAYFGKLDRC